MDTRVDLGTQLIDAPLISFSLSTWCLSAVVGRHRRTQKTTYSERTFKELLAGTSGCSLREWTRGTNLWARIRVTHLLHEGRVKSLRLPSQLFKFHLVIKGVYIRLCRCRSSRERSGRSNGRRSNGGNWRRIDSALDLVGLWGLRGSSEGPQLASGGFGHGFFESLDEGWLRG